MSVEFHARGDRRPRHRRTSAEPPSRENDIGRAVDASGIRPMSVGEGMSVTTKARPLHTTGP